MIVNTKLKELLNQEKWKAMQDAIANVLKMTVATYDYKGNLICEYSNISDFCKCIRQDSTLSKKCDKCIAFGGYESFRQGKAYLFLCHMDLINAAIPLSVENEYLGHVVVGGGKGDKNLLEKTEALYQNTDISHLSGIPYKMDEKLASIREISCEQLEEGIKLIEQILNYSLEISYKRNLSDEKERRHLLSADNLTENQSEDEISNVSILFPAFD